MSYKAIMLNSRTPHALPTLLQKNQQKNACEIMKKEIGYRRFVVRSFAPRMQELTKSKTTLQVNDNSS